MKALSKFFVLLLATIGLASCGGGGGGSSNAFTPTPVDTITVSAAATSIPTNSFTTLTVTVKKGDGTFENNGTVVSASLAPSTIGTVSSGASGAPAGTTATNTLSGGSTTFNFTSSNQSGTATVTFSVTTTPTVATTSFPITVTPGNTNDPRLVLSPSAVTLPLNPFASLAEVGPDFVSNFIGSPYVAEITLTWRHSNGQLVNGTSTVNVSIDPVSVASFSQLDDPKTKQADLTKPDGNEFLVLLGSGPINVTGGNGVIFIHAEDIPGNAILTVTAIDPDNNQTISSQVKVNVAGAASNLPASIFATSGGAAYVSSSGGAQSTLVNATVFDGNDVNVVDPTGFDNVQFQIVGPSTSDARLSGLNAAGLAVVGSTVKTVTHNGVANVSFLAGSQQGAVQIKATADRGDNNVDDGIQDAVSSTTTVIVSDGKLYSLTLTSPVENAIIANAVSSDVAVAPGTVPGSLNATYSLTVTAIGNDRQGNPVLPGTEIKFGSIDPPVSGHAFSISGVQGNPQEGGTLFTATDGHFQTAGGGAGPGDTLVVFGKAVVGNSDLESAAKVAARNSETSLTLSTPFNRNDTTGVSVDYGPVLPYVVGRSLSGNISSPAQTNAIGAATTTLNYPVSVLGEPLTIWAQSNGTDNITGQSTLVTDAALYVYPGIAPGKITISPNPIPGNITTTVFACIQDALQEPISGVRFNFSFAGLGFGSGKLDGISTAGVVPDVTGADGCVATTVVTNGLDSSTAATLTFSFGTLSATAPIKANGGLVLLAAPSALGGTGGVVTLTLLTSDGTPVPNVQLQGICSGDPSISIVTQAGQSVPILPTNVKGQTTVAITAALNKIGSAGTGSCVFSPAGGTPSATVTLQGIDLCTVQTSPQAEGCGTTTTNVSVQLKIISTTGNANASFSSDPSGLTCSIAAALSNTCTATVPTATYTLTVTLGSGTTFVGWSGNCAASGTGNNGVLIVSTAGETCTLVVTGS